MYYITNFLVSITSFIFQADEMGLGKTVEVLGCVLSNKWQPPAASDGSTGYDPTEEEAGTNGGAWMQGVRREERVECVCGADGSMDEESIEQSWVQCDTCDSWQHAECVNLRGGALKNIQVS
jgi:E3 ubiquitin-protein ligase SHPRH